MGIEQSSRYLILGNSAAALGAIEALRRADPASSITVVAAEALAAYSPVMLTYFISGKVGRDRLFLTDEAFYRRAGVRFLSGVAATKVDEGGKKVHLADGRALGYEKLLIATGSSPARVNVEGEELPGVYSLKWLSDAEKISSAADKALAGGRRGCAAVLGGGLIGLQTACALAGRGLEVSVLIGSAYPLSRNVDAECGAMIAAHLGESGITLRTGASVKEISPCGESFELSLGGEGETLSADLVCLGKGVRANSAPVAGGTVALHPSGAIEIDEGMRTSVEGIYAAGDVAIGPSYLDSTLVAVPTWPNAVAQGKVAGANMAGLEKVYKSLPGNITSLSGKVVASVGAVSGDDVGEEVRHIDRARGIYRKLAFGSEGELVGVVSFGAATDMGIMQGLVKRRERLTLAQRNEFVRHGANYGKLTMSKVAGALIPRGGGGGFNNR